MLNNSLSVVLPAYNEEGNILEIINKILKILPSVTYDFEIIAVDDGSTDKTANILEKLKASDARLKVVRHPRNLGYGASLRSGFKKVEKELIFYMDADQQFDIADITRLTAYIEDYDIVIGFRKNRRDPFYRSFFSYCFNLIVKSLFGILTKARIHQLRIKQVAVNHYPRIYGRQTGSSLKVILTILWEMGKLKMQLAKPASQ
ncbi:MAG: hypothetical protein AMJ95_07350 [Omnitrophica WOR_2 bacterium SM23_72]|nr:MAG: hypothetical protein AMJ95_07350 [Omnitrophica WOR_2 bacterium SM23_72]